MTIDKVIQSGVNLNSNISIFSESIWWFIILGALLAIIICLLWCRDFETTGAFITIFFIVGFALIVINGFHESDKKAELVQQWKQNVVYPYIESLPTQKNEIVYIKINTTLSHDVEGGLFYTYSVPVKLTPLTISFKGSGVETYTNWYETNMELTDEKKPFIEYKRLDKDLGNGVNAGLYDVNIYLPKSYQFTEIK